MWGKGEGKRKETGTGCAIWLAVDHKEGILYIAKKNSLPFSGGREKKTKVMASRGSEYPECLQWGRWNNSILLKKERRTTGGKREDQPGPIIRVFIRLQKRSYLRERGNSVVFTGKRKGEKVGGNCGAGFHPSFRTRNCEEKKGAQLTLLRDAGIAKSGGGRKEGSGEKRGLSDAVSSPPRRKERPCAAFRWGRGGCVSARGKEKREWRDEKTWRSICWPIARTGVGGSGLFVNFVSREERLPEKKGDASNIDQQRYSSRNRRYCDSEKEDFGIKDQGGGEKREGEKKKSVRNLTAPYAGTS